MNGEIRLAHGLVPSAEAWMLAAGRHQGIIDADERPLVLPFVIHTGTGPWRASDGMKPLAELPPAAAAEVAPHQPQA